MRFPLIASPLPLRPARAHELELLDIPGHDPAILASNLSDLRCWRAG